MSESQLQSQVPTSYSHQNIAEELDGLKRLLMTMKESIFDVRLRAHVLEADLATLYDPVVEADLRQAKEDCERCCTIVQDKD